VVWIARRHVPETSDATAVGRLDMAGAGLATATLGTLIYGLIQEPVRAGRRAAW